MPSPDARRDRRGRGGQPGAARRFAPTSARCARSAGRTTSSPRPTSAIERLVARVAAVARSPATGWSGRRARATASRETGFTWTVDPVDGTWNFASGIPHWCVVVACADARRAGRRRDRRPGARTSCGARCAAAGELRLNGAPAPPRPVREIADSTWAAALGPAFREPRWQGLMGRIGPVRLMGSLALDLAWTAAGRLDAFAYTCDRKPWDVWAGEVMARERGLVVREEPDVAAARRDAARLVGGAGARGRRGLRLSHTVRLMRMRGLEPPRPEGHRHLKPARLPIPPHPLAGRREGSSADAP